MRSKDLSDVYCGMLNPADTHAPAPPLPSSPGGGSPSYSMRSTTYAAGLGLLARACLLLRLEDAKAGLLYSQYHGILAFCTAQHQV